MVLDNCVKSKDYIIHEVPNMHLLKSLGIRKGIKFQVQTKQPLQGPVVIKVGNRSIAVDKSLAKQIEVQEV